VPDEAASSARQEDTCTDTNAIHDWGCTVRRAGALLIGVVLWLDVGAAGAQTDPKAKKPVAPEVTQTLNAMVEAQRSLAADLAQLRDELRELQRAIGDVRDDLRQDRDTAQGHLEQIKGMREEVRGLYVESSGLKGDIAQLGKQVEGVEASLGNFRFSTGIVAAVIIVLQVVLVGLMFRGRDNNARRRRATRRPNRTECHATHVAMDHADGGGGCPRLARVRQRCHRRRGGERCGRGAHARANRDPLPRSLEGGELSGLLRLHLEGDDGREEP